MSHENRHRIQSWSDSIEGPHDDGVSTIPLTDAKARLNELVEETALTHERVTITRHGRPAAVIIAVEDLEAMEETLFWQSQPGVRADLEAGSTAAREELYDESAVRRRYGIGPRR
jgi:antitoxin YefM